MKKTCLNVKVTKINKQINKKYSFTTFPEKCQFWWKQCLAEINDNQQVYIRGS